MLSGFWKKNIRARRGRTSAHYRLHKEEARRVILARLVHFGIVYGYTWNRVAIRDQRRRWGSCSSRGNLNFNYRLLFLPDHLRDYVVVHELCHLKEMNHGAGFWQLVARACPDYQSCITELRQLERATGLKPVAIQKHVTENGSFRSPSVRQPDTITL